MLQSYAQTGNVDTVRSLASRSIQEVLCLHPPIINVPTSDMFRDVGGSMFMEYCINLVFSSRFNIKQVGRESPCAFHIDDSRSRPWPFFVQPADPRPVPWVALMVQSPIHVLARDPIHQSAASTPTSERQVLRWWPRAVGVSHPNQTTRT